MLVHAKRGELVTIASQAVKAVPKKTTVKELSGIHIEADARRSMLTMTATNHEIAIRTSIPANVESSGSAIVNAALLTTALSKLSNDDVDLGSPDPGSIAIRSGSAFYRFGALPGDRYPMPELPFPEDTVPVSGLCSLARNTLFVVPGESRNPLLQCVRVTLGPEGLRAVGTNGFCIVEAAGDKSCKGRSELLLPAHALKVLASISSDNDVYEMGLNEKSLIFWNGALLFSARLMTGAYPNIAGVFSSFQGEYSVHLDADELFHALESVSVLAEKNPRVELSFGEHELLLAAQTDFGKASRSVKALVLSAPKAPFYYDYRKLLDYLCLVHGSVTLEFSTQGLLSICPGDTRYLQSPLRPPRKEEQAQMAA